MRGIDKVIALAESQSALARRLGVSQQAVNLWAKEGFVPINRAFELQRLFGVPAIELVSEKYRPKALKRSF